MHKIIVFFSIDSCCFIRLLTLYIDILEMATLEQILVYYNCLLQPIYCKSW